jgi:hypothetical protein
MREIINKPVPDQRWWRPAGRYSTAGWHNIKLYFMIGHPAETMEDVRAIARLCKDVLQVGKQIIGGRAQVTAGVSTFVPKPHTPFQWVACDTVDQINAKQRYLKTALRGKGLKLNGIQPKIPCWKPGFTRRQAHGGCDLRSLAREQNLTPGKSILIIKSGFRLSKAGLDPTFILIRTPDR